MVGENGFTAEGKNVFIQEAANRVYSDDFYSKKKSGVLSGGIGITFGSQKQSTEADQSKYYATGSQVGSLNGEITIIAENAYKQTASTVNSANGDVNILAKKVAIEAGSDKYESNLKQTVEQKGVTIAITLPILSALEAVQGTINSAKTVGQSKAALKEAKEVLSKNNSETNHTLEEQAQENFELANAKAKAWETGGSQRRILDSALNILSTALAGRPAAEVAASGLSPTINSKIKEATTTRVGGVNWYNPHMNDKINTCVKQRFTQLTKTTQPKFPKGALCLIVGNTHGENKGK